MNILVGEEYRLNVANAGKSYYKVVEKFHDGSIKVQGPESYPRYVLPEAFEGAKTKQKKSKVVFRHTNIKLYGQLLGRECWIVDIHEFPKGEKRGRKRKA